MKIPSLNGLSFTLNTHTHTPTPKEELHSLTEEFSTLPVPYKSFVTGRELEVMAKKKKEKEKKVVQILAKCVPIRRGRRGGERRKKRDFSFFLIRTNKGRPI